ncbi:MAG: hypothetical protein LBT40_09710 [Deltaproteobacteria bacterium]|nr:hypothetical protein [Deltaproteobacteria bacterium]
MRYGLTNVFPWLDSCARAYPYTLWLWEDVPLDRLARAVDAYGLGADPSEPVLLMDDTRFPGRRAGLLLTTGDLCARARHGEARRIPLERAGTAEAYGKTLAVNGKPFVSLKRFSPLAVAMAAKLVTVFAGLKRAATPLPPAGSRLPLPEGEILDALDFMLCGAGRVSVKPSIDPARLEGALASYAKGVRREDVLFLAYNALPWGAKAGIVAVRDAAYAMDAGEAPRSARLGPPAASVTRLGKAIRVNGVHLADMNTMKEPAAEAVRLALCYLAGLTDTGGGARSGGLLP